MVSKKCARYVASWKPFGRGVGYTYPAQSEYDHPAGPMRSCAMADCRVGVEPQRVNAWTTSRIAAGCASCYAVLTMRCGNTICVAVLPSGKNSYRCIHETVHQLQACGCARNRRETKLPPYRKTNAAFEKL